MNFSPLKLILLCCSATALGSILTAGPPGPAAGARSQQPAQATAVNNEDCAICHDELVQAFNKTPHAVLEKSPKHNLKNSCESCHGPGEAHVAGDGDKTNILTFTGPDKAAYNRQCLACHDKTHEVTGFNSSLHAKSGLACADCHSPHKGVRMTRLLRQPANDLCLSCHEQARADFRKPYHHRVPENSMRCVDCHQPHGGLERRQIRTTSTGEIACLRCHIDKQGPFVFEHAPLRLGDCQACHQPHGSNYAKMLVRPNVRELCLECHSRSDNVIVAQPPAFHDQRSPRYRNCTTCHIRIHGSNSSRRFLR